MTLNVGDWVVNILNSRLGYITNSAECDVYHVKWYSENGRKVHAAGWYGDYELELAPIDIHNEDIMTMQHIAVNTGDRDWFHSLSERMKHECKFG